MRINSERYQHNAPPVSAGKKRQQKRERGSSQRDSIPSRAFSFPNGPYPPNRDLPFRDHRPAPEPSPKLTAQENGKSSSFRRAAPRHKNINQRLAQKLESGKVGDTTLQPIYFEAGEGFWDLLANFALWLLRHLHLDGLLFAVQLVALSLVIQHYLPPLGRYYFDRTTSAMLLPTENHLDQLLNEDILLTELQVSGNTTPPIDIASISASTLPPSTNSLSVATAKNTALAKQTKLAKSKSANSAGTDDAPLSRKQLQSIIHPAYKASSYTVKNGESISLLAQRYHLKMSTLISVNRIKRAKNLKAGQSILIPNMDGLLYRVQPRDALASIARKFESSIGVLIDTNQLQSKKLLAGNYLFIPGASLTRYQLRQVFGQLYIYPHTGRLSSSFGYRRDPFRRSARELHDGLDIVGPYGAAIKASSDGTVAAVGFNSIYGRYLILQHAKGMKTLYGHMSKILIAKGQRVAQGQRIGNIGSSGRSTGPHVHFGIFVAGKAVNPLDYLNEF